MNLAAEDPVSIARAKAFGQGLQSLGWIEGRTVHVDYRWAAGTADLFHRYATEFAASLPDISVASGGRSVAGSPAGDAHDPNRVRHRSRSRWQWLCREPVTAGRQRHRLLGFRVQSGGEVG